MNDDGNGQNDTWGIVWITAVVILGIMALIGSIHACDDPDSYECFVHQNPRDSDGNP